MAYLFAVPVVRTELATVCSLYEMSASLRRYANGNAA